MLDAVDALGNETVDGDIDRDERESDGAGESTERASAASDDPALPGRGGVRRTLAVGLLIVVALGALGGWLGFRAYGSHLRTEQREAFLAAARQGALNLTTISYTEADADVKRILGAATGAFYDDFQQRSRSFVDVVEKARSRSQGTVTAVGLESMNGDDARALAAAVVTTTSGGQAQAARAWRMRIDLHRVGNEVKISNVEFVP